MYTRTQDTHTPDLRETYLLRECHDARSQEVASAAAAVHAQEECKAAQRRGLRLEGELQVAAASIEALRAMVHELEAEVRSGLCMHCVCVCVCVCVYVCVCLKFVYTYAHTDTHTHTHRHTDTHTHTCTHTHTTHTFPHVTRQRASLCETSVS